MTYKGSISLEDVSQVKSAEDHYKLCDAGGREWARFSPSRENVGDAQLIAPPAIRISLPTDEEIQFEMMLLKKYDVEPLDDSPAYIRGAVSEGDTSE